MKINLKKSCEKEIYTPKKKEFIKWAKLIFKNKNVEITIKLVTKQEIIELNKKYKKKKTPTNVLTFPLKINYIDNYNHPLYYYLGDIIICSKIINNEAYLYKKNIKERWAHIFIHSTLHLLGYQHNSTTARNIMESIEKKNMNILGYQNPYKTNKKYI